MSIFPDWIGIATTKIPDNKPVDLTGVIVAKAPKAINVATSEDKNVNESAPLVENVTFVNESDLPQYPTSIDNLSSDQTESVHRPPQIIITR